MHIDAVHRHQGGFTLSHEAAIDLASPLANCIQQAAHARLVGCVGYCARAPLRVLQRGIEASSSCCPRSKVNCCFDSSHQSRDISNARRLPRSPCHSYPVVCCVALSCRARGRSPQRSPTASSPDVCPTRSLSDAPVDAPPTPPPRSRDQRRIQ